MDLAVNSTITKESFKAEFWKLLLTRERHARLCLKITVLWHMTSRTQVECHECSEESTASIFSFWYMASETRRQPSGSLNVFFHTVTAYIRIKLQRMKRNRNIFARDFSCPPQCTQLRSSLFWDVTRHCVSSCPTFRDCLSFPSSRLYRNVFKNNQHTLRDRGANASNINPRLVVRRNSESFINTEYSSARIPR